MSSVPIGNRQSPIGNLDSQNPWLGLASFTEETRAYFHGRDEEVAELGRRVQRKLLTILFGQSGLGKTSILRAGIVPRLRPEGYCPVYVRLDYGRESPPPSEQIKQAVLRATQAAGHWTQPGVSQTGESLWEFLHHRDDVLRDAAGRTLVPLLIFDQFEEIFTLAQGDDFGRQRAAQFIEDLADLVENRAPKALEAKLERDEAAMERFDFARADYRILIALREDYLAHLEGLKARMPSVTQNRMRLARMTGTQALAAVAGPGGALVNEEVARAIVGFVAGSTELARAEVEPSLLSLVCRELNNTRVTQGRPEISADLLAGSRDTILSEFYERTLADQPAGVQVFIEDELLTDSGYRESIAEERVQKGFAAAGAPAEALATLVDRRLLRVEERLDVRRVELTHDVLVGVVKASRDVRQEREARAAEEKRRQQTEVQLATAQALEAEARRAAARSRFIAIGCTALAAVAIGMAMWGYVNLRRAEAAEDRVALERDGAQTARAEAEKLVTFLLDDLYTQLEPTGRTEIVSGLARRALAYFDALPAGVRDARNDRYRAVALSRLGFALSQEGKTLEAESPLREAEELLLKLDREGPEGEGVAVDLAAVLRNQSRNAYLQNRSTVGLERGERALAIIQPIAMRATALPLTRMEHGRCQMNQGFGLMRDRQNPQALACLQEARGIFKALMGETAFRQPASVLYAENSAWLTELARFMGRHDEMESLLNEGLQIADAAVEGQAGNLGALRSRALLRGRKAALALDRHALTEAEKLARQTAADWTEFLRFDPANSTARNNRRVVMNAVGEALWRQGQVDAVVEIARVALREVVEKGGSPSAVRGAAFDTAFLAGIAAELGTPTDIEAAMVDVNRLRQISVSQMEAENYFRLSLPTWNELDRARMLLSNGQHGSALTAAQAVSSKVRQLSPASGAEAANHRFLVRTHCRLQVEAALALQRWSEAVKPARDLVAGRPALDDTSDEAFNQLADDRALAAVALARVGESVEAHRLLEQAEEFNRARRAAGARDHGTRFQSAVIALGRGLLTTSIAERRAALGAGLAEIVEMPEQPKQLRFVRELKAVLEKELAQAGA